MPVSRVDVVSSFRAVALLSLAFWASSPALAEAPAAAADFFRARCASCHTIGGGPLSGPDLKGALDRKDRAWLVNFVMDPQRVLSSGDPYALELQRAARGAVMPTIPDLTRPMAEDLMELLVVESAEARSQFAGSAVDDRAVLPADIQAGHDLFVGRRPLAGGGPACISCHDVAPLPSLGGGRLGPTLDQAFGRLGGRKALSAWLAAPPSPTMTPIYKGSAFTPDEIFALVAYLEDVSRAAAPPRAGAGMLAFFFGGTVGAGLLLGGIDLVWKRRSRGVRRPMVEAARRGTQEESHDDEK